MSDGLSLFLGVSSLVFLDLSLNWVPVFVSLVCNLHCFEVEVEGLSLGLLFSEVLINFSVKALLYVLLVLEPVIVKVLIEEFHAISI